MRDPPNNRRYNRSYQVRQKLYVAAMLSVLAGLMTLYVLLRIFMTRSAPPPTTTCTPTWCWEWETTSDDGASGTNPDKATHTNATQVLSITPQLSTTPLPADAEPPSPPITPTPHEETNPTHASASSMASRSPTSTAPNVEGKNVILALTSVGAHQYRNPLCPSRPNVLYLTVGVSLWGAGDPASVIKVIILPESNPSTPAVTYTDQGVTIFNVESTNDIPTHEIFTQVTGLSEVNQWLAWLVGTVCLQGLSDCVACHGRMDLLAMHP